MSAGRQRAARRVQRLDRYLERRGLEAVWFADPDSFAWLTGGDNVVDERADAGVAAVGYDGDALTVVTSNIEAPRLRAEELPEDVPIRTFEWYEQSLAEAVASRTPEPVAADFDVPGAEDVDARALRRPLGTGAIDAYRELGADAAAVVEGVCERLSATDTERDVAGRIRRRLAARGIDGPVVLVGSAERAQRYRHYTPTDAELGDYALVSVTAERDGLYASLTRSVTFDAPDWFARRKRASARVATTALAATREYGTRSGGTAGDAFEALERAYAETGFPDEWRRHHQGGAAGFAGREWIATPSSDASIELPMAYAWNPTVEGTKTEDTWLVTEDGFECLTEGEWAREPAAAVGFDATLEHAAPLER